MLNVLSVVLLLQSAIRLAVTLSLALQLLYSSRPLTHSYSIRHLGLVSSHDRNLSASASGVFDILALYKLDYYYYYYYYDTTFTRSSLLYATGVSLGPPESSMQTASRSLQPFLQGSLDDKPTADHATQSVTIGRAHSGEAKFGNCLRLQQVFIGAVDSADQINFSNQQLYSAVRLDGLQCMWRHTTI